MSSAITTLIDATRRPTVFDQLRSCRGNECNCNRRRDRPTEDSELKRAFAYAGVRKVALSAGYNLRNYVWHLDPFSLTRKLPLYNPNTVPACGYLESSTTTTTCSFRCSTGPCFRVVSVAGCTSRSLTAVSAWVSAYVSRWHLVNLHFSSSQ